ncbi:MAG: hypothetical protein JWM80_2723 [Cyanobacteria bacterium RYN_339]|nr:hypothetical protein [Cyanobacteria bacterium RYN_339]
MSLKALVQLAVAAACLSGCSLNVKGLTPPTPVKAVVTPSGDVKLAFTGLATYQTLAVGAQVARVAITLTPAKGPAQKEIVQDAQLRQPQVAVSFRKVAVGKASLAVQAYDADGNRVGEGSGGAVVVAGVTVEAHVGVKLAAGTGGLRAVIDFYEAPACDARYDEFDLNHDGRLERDEFRPLWVRDHQLYPMYTLDCAPAYPIDPPMPILKIEPAMAAFNGLDADGDNFLSPAEMCSYDAPTPYPILVEPKPPVPVTTPPMPEPAPDAPAVSAVAIDFEALDTNHDGVVSWQEEATANGALQAGAKTRLYDHFRQVDRNNNGTLERDEYSFAK